MQGLKRRIERIEDRLGANRPHIVYQIRLACNADEPLPPDKEFPEYGYTLHFGRYCDLGREKRKAQV